MSFEIKLHIASHLKVLDYGKCIYSGQGNGRTFSVLPIIKLQITLISLHKSQGRSKFLKSWDERHCKSQAKREN